MTQNRSIDANQDPSFSFRSRYGRAMAAKLKSVPKDAASKLAANAPSIWSFNRLQSVQLEQ